MNKKIILSSFASLLFLSQAANAEIKIGQGSLTFNAGVNSQYISRGIDQNRDKPSPFIGADFSIPVIEGFGFYAGAWTAAADYVSGAGGQERDYYAGITKTIGNTTLDLGYISYNYPGATNSSEKQTAEYYVKATVAPEKQPYTFGVAVYQDDTNGQYSSNQKYERYYIEGNATYDFGVAQGKISYGIYDNDTNTTTVSLSKEFYTVDFTASYISAQKENNSISSLNKGREYLTLSATKKF